MASVPGIPIASRDVNLEQQKSVDDIWQQVQAKVVQLAGGDEKNIRKLGIDDVLGYLDRFQNNKKPEKLERLKGAVDKTLQCIQTVGSIVSSGVSTVFGPADICCNALTFVIQAWQGYEGIFENLAELLEKCMEFLDRLVYYNEKMDARLLRVACQNLQLFVDICERTIKLRRKHTRFLAFTKMLFLNDDGIQDLLGLMDRLNSKESLLVAAQTFEIVSDSATQINAIVQGQKEQRNTQDAKDRRQKVADALGFRPTELGKKGEPIATWKSSFDLHKNTVIATTGEWLWEDSVFLDWSRAEQPQTPVIVLQGEDGSGKSLMMANAIRHLQKQSQDSPTSRIVTAYSFTEHDSKTASQDPRECLETASKALLWQIAVSFEAMTKSVAQIAQASSGFDGWLDVWDQLFINNSERFNPDTTFFIFVDGIDTDMRSFVSVFQKLCSGSGMGKVRIMLTAGSRMMAECNHHMKDIKFEAIPLASRNISDIKKYINYRMDSMPTLRDSTRPGISDWRKRILDDLSVKCVGDYYKLSSSLSALSQMDLIEDVESVLADANKTRSGQIDAEIAHLNNTRTAKEIQEINDIILWVDSGRRWLPVDMIESLISMRHQLGFAAADGDSPRQSDAASRGATLTVSLLPLSQKLREKYPLFDVTKTNLVKWRTPETKDRIPSKDAQENTTLGRPRIQQTEVNIVRHFLHNVCPEEMYGRFDFESFLTSRLGVERQEYICRDPDNAHIKIVIAYLTVMTDEAINDIGNTTQYARRDLLYHLKQVDLSAADKDYKVQVGPLLVRLLTEEKGVTSLFLSTESLRLWEWAMTEYNHLTEIRAEWLYSTEGTKEVLRWFSDSTVTKSIQGDLATSFVQGIKSAEGNLHRLVFSHAAKYLARYMFQRKTIPVHNIAACIFLRGYLLRCDPVISTQMANDAAFYIAKETDAAKELENQTNFTVNSFEAIETWAANALNKSENSPAEDCEWALRAFYLMGAMCQGVPMSEFITRAIEAARLDPTNIEAQYCITLNEDMEHAKCIEMLSKLLKELQVSMETDTLLQARATIALGNRLWDLGEDYDLAAQTHLESLRYGHFGLQSRLTYRTILRRYKDKFSRLVVFINGLNNCTAAWTPFVDELVVEMSGPLGQARQIAEVADKNQQWDILKTFYNTAIEYCDQSRFVELVFALRRLLADTLEYSSDKERRDERVVLYEAGLEGIKDDDQAKGNIGTFIIYLAVDNLAAAYAEKAFASDASPETVELYISKLANLLAFAENDEKSLRAVTPVCCLIRHRHGNNHYADLTKTWTRRIMLEIIELLSDDDEENDYNAYLYLYQILIALGDFDNSRVAVAMLKWMMHMRYVRQEERKLNVKPGYATTGFEKSEAAAKDSGQDAGEEIGGDKPSSSREAKEEAVESDDAAPGMVTENATDPAASPNVSAPSEEGLEEKSDSPEAKFNLEGQHTDIASSPSPKSEEQPKEDKPPLMWLNFCDCCEEPELLAQDHPMYVCIECVQASFTDSDCYSKMNRGEELEVKSECKGHKCFFVPAWKPDVEFLSGSVPVLGAVGDGDEEVEFQGWMAMDAWKGELRKLYIDI